MPAAAPAYDPPEAGPTAHERNEATMSDTDTPGDQADDEITGASVVNVAEGDLDGDGVTDAVEVTTITGVDVDGDGEPDIVEVATVTAFDVDGDGVPDLVTSTTITSVDVDGDGVADAVVVVEAVGVDANGDGVITEDEIEITETVLVRDDDAG